MGSIFAICRDKATQRSSSLTKTASETRSKRKDSMSKYVSQYHKSIFESSDFDPLKSKPKPLTQRQKMLLQKSWNYISSIPDPLKTVLDGFVRMFVLAPESVQVFTFLRDDLSCDPEHAEKIMLKNTVMRKHLSQVFGVLGDILKDLDAWEAAPMDSRIELGRRHMWYGAKTEFIKALCDGFLFAFEKTLWPDVSSEILQAWEDLLLHVAQDWALGYQAEAECKRQGKKNPFLEKPKCGHEQPEAGCPSCQAKHNAKLGDGVDEPCEKPGSVTSPSVQKGAVPDDSGGSSSERSSSNHKQVPPIEKKKVVTTDVASPK